MGKNLLNLKQCTTSRIVSQSGYGLFTGKEVTLELRPAKEDTGIVFVRSDLSALPKIPAKLDYVSATKRCTTLQKDGVSVSMVEHLLSALYAMQIDNVEIVLNQSEVPCFDGSATTFTTLIEQAGTLTQNKYRKQGKLTAPVYFSKGETHLIALPKNELQLSYTLHYPNITSLKGYAEYTADSQIYKDCIAPCRTFCVYEEIEPLLAQGVFPSAGLKSAVVIKENQVLNQEGFRFENEPARHKILDMLGDFSLLGMPVLAHIVAIRSGHFTNIAFAKQLQRQLEIV